MEERNYDWYKDIRDRIRGFYACKKKVLLGFWSNRGRYKIKFWTHNNFIRGTIYRAETGRTLETCIFAIAIKTELNLARIRFVWTTKSTLRGYKSKFISLLGVIQWTANRFTRHRRWSKISLWALFNRSIFKLSLVKRGFDRAWLRLLYK